MIGTSLAWLAAPAWAAQVGGVMLQDKLTADGKELELNGAGICAPG
jgi:hypothetical protein